MVPAFCGGALLELCSVLALQLVSLMPHGPEPACNGLMAHGLELAAAVGTSSRSQMTQIAVNKSSPTGITDRPFSHIGTTSSTKPKSIKFHFTPQMNTRELISALQKVT